MRPGIARRDFLKIAAIATAPAVAFRLTAAAPPAKSAGAEAEGLTTYELGPQVWVRLNNRPLTCYRAHRSQKYPYMYPLAGPLTGLPLTDETTLPYPHHRSLFFACDKVNGGNYWQEGFEQGQILSNGPKIGKADKNAIEILDSCDWQKPGGPVVMRDKRRILITASETAARTIDWEIEWEAVGKVVISKTNHSLFSMRAARDITPAGGGTLMNADGATGEKETSGQKSAWCAFYGKRLSAKDTPVEGICIMDHPGNPWAPTEWFTRDYGFASPTPLYFRDGSFEMEAGKPLKFKYRVMLFSGDPQDAQLARHYADFVH
jgi:hypothetical protein